MLKSINQAGTVRKRDWLSRLLNIITVTGEFEIRCAYDAPWRISYGQSAEREIPFHVVLNGKATLGSRGEVSSQQPGPGDIVLLPHGSAHVLHEGSGAAASPAHVREAANLGRCDNEAFAKHIELFARAGILADHKAGHPRLFPAMSAILQAPAKQWTLRMLAQLCNMSRATFMRHFETVLGRSATDLLADTRMSIAANALRNPPVGTEAVAELVGYQSIAAFRRAFTQRTGNTPGEWRRTARQVA
jgi:AraC-like DNA-binding protein